MEESNEGEEEYVPPYCIPIRADVRTFDWDVKSIFIFKYLSSILL